MKRSIDNSGTEAETHPIIQTSRLTKAFGIGGAQVLALRGVDLSLHRSEFVALMGPSGSGKSTFMNIIGCLDEPTSGEYLFEGVNVRGLDKDQLALVRRHYLGFIFQGFNLLRRTTALENVELPLLYQGVPARQRREQARRVLCDVGLTGRERHTPSELSGGQQQRVAIARALITNPAVLLADEPTGNLDSRTSQEIMELMVTLNKKRGITILMVTHEREMAEYAGRLVSFNDGAIQSDCLIGENLCSSES